MNRTTPYERVFLGIAVTVTVVWATATIVQIVLPEHMVPTYANLLMVTVAGAFFGGSILSAKKRLRGSEDDDDPYEGPGGYYRA